MGSGQPWLFYSREPPNGTWAQTELVVARLQVSGAPLTPIASVNHPQIAVGQTLGVTIGLTNPGLSGSVDIYVGLIGPDNSLQFFTGGGIVAVNPTDLASFPPLAAGVPLETPFSVTVRDFYSLEWTGSEPHGVWLLFFAALNAGALAGGTIPAASVAGFASASFSFP